MTVLFRCSNSYNEADCNTQNETVVAIAMKRDLRLGKEIARQSDEYSAMKLEEFNLEHSTAFLAMMEDFLEHDPKTFERYFKRPVQWNPFEFKKYALECEEERMDWRPKAKAVSRTHYVVRENPNTIIGYGLLQFPLTSESENDGGNLFVAIPPKFRGQGNGGFCLSLLLFEAVRAGLRRAFVTCAAEDKAARRVIEKNRGEFLDEVKTTHQFGQNELVARYWIHFS